MKKILFILALALLSVPVLAQRTEAYQPQNPDTDLVANADMIRVPINNPDSQDSITVKVMKKVPAAFEKKLIGKHKFSLQWISWDYFGSVDIVKLEEGKFRCVGSQLSKENDDYIFMDGTIEVINEKELLFTGKIRIKIYHLNGGKEYEKTGTHLFKSTKGRKFWRMQDMDNPDGAVDYVDIRFK